MCVCVCVNASFVWDCLVHTGGRGNGDDDGDNDDTGSGVDI